MVDKKYFLAKHVFLATKKVSTDIFFGLKKFEGKTVVLVNNFAWQKKCLMKKNSARNFFWLNKYFNQTLVWLAFFFATFFLCHIFFGRHFYSAGGETSGETGEAGGKTGGETGPPLANSPTMHSRVVCKEPKSLLLNGAGQY